MEDPVSLLFVVVGVVVAPWFSLMLGAITGVGQ